MNFVCVGFELCDKMLTLSSMENLIVLCKPQTVADPAIYIIAGALPVEATIHTRALGLYGSIARLDETSVEKQQARRQLSVKSYR